MAAESDAHAFVLRSPYSLDAGGIERRPIEFDLLPADVARDRNENVDLVVKLAQQVDVHRRARDRHISDHHHQCHLEHIAVLELAREALVNGARPDR